MKLRLSGLRPTTRFASRSRAHRRTAPPGTNIWQTPPSGQATEDSRNTTPPAISQGESKFMLNGLHKFHLWIAGMESFR